MPLPWCFLWNPSLGWPSTVGIQSPVSNCSDLLCSAFFFTACCCVLSYYACFVVWCGVVWFAVLCCVVLCCVVLCCAVLCCAVLCCAVLCCVLFCFALLCYVMLCYVYLMSLQSRLHSICATNENSFVNSKDVSPVENESISANFFATGKDFLFNPKFGDSLPCTYISLANPGSVGSVGG